MWLEALSLPLYVAEGRKMDGYADQIKTLFLDLKEGVKREV